MTKSVQELISFLEYSPTPWHTVEVLAKNLKGFSKLDLKKPWKLTKGKSYYTICGGALFAFTLPTAKPKSARLLASHTDSPALKLKQDLSSVEVYGGPILSTWFDRDLLISGRIIKSNGQEELFTHDQLTLIPSLAIHLGKKETEIKKQEELRPLFDDTLAKKLKNSLAHDLYLIPNEAPAQIGTDLIAGYRLDNLLSAYAGMHALLKAKKSPHLQIGMFWNHEEVGSGSTEGAKAPLFEEIFRRISLAYNLSEEEHYCLKRNSLCISSDNAHAFHPNYPTKYDKPNAPTLGDGFAIKHNANMRYATNAEGTAAVRSLCKKKKIKVQDYTSHSDAPCGSTVGSLMATATGILTVDIGIPQLAMHSAREVAHMKDIEALTKYLTAALED